MTTHGKKSRPRAKLGKAKLPYKERLKRGFARVERDLSWMMGIFRELLEELGEKEVGEVLPILDVVKEKFGLANFVIDEALRVIVTGKQIGRAHV